MTAPKLLPAFTFDYGVYSDSTPVAVAGRLADAQWTLRRLEAFIADGDVDMARIVLQGARERGELDGVASR